MKITTLKLASDIACEWNVSDYAVNLIIISKPAG